MKLDLLLKDSKGMFGEKIELGLSFINPQLDITIDENLTLLEQLNKKEDFKNFIKDYKEYSNFLAEEREEDEDIKLIEKNLDNLFDIVEYISFSFQNTDFEEYIKKNPAILTKKIVLPETIGLNEFEKVEKYLSKYENNKDHIYVKLEGNMDYVSLEDAYKVLLKIKYQAEQIKSLNLSPMETIMYTYDVVRNRIYKFEDNDQKFTESRDYARVLLGDKIVCAGYASLYSAILKYIGIDMRVSHLDDINNPVGGHARNVAYIKDEKYDIDGVYYFDATWDSKNNEQDINYVNKYRFFAKPKKYMMNYDQREGLIEKSLSSYGKMLDLNANTFYTNMAATLDYIKTINNMNVMINNKSLVNIDDILSNKIKDNEIDEAVIELYGKYNKIIPADTMLKLYNNVRKVEYYQNPKLYGYSQKDFKATLDNSDWIFESEIKALTYSSLLSKIFGEEQDIEIPDHYEVFDEFYDNNNIEKNIQQVKLTKTLSKVLEKKRFNVK